MKNLLFVWVCLFFLSVLSGCQLSSSGSDGRSDDGNSTGSPEIEISYGGAELVSGTGSVNLGAVSVGKTKTYTFIVKNKGTGPLALSGSPRVVVGGTNASMFVVSTQPPSSIASGAQGSFVLSFAPTSAGSLSGTLTVSSDDADEGSYTIALTGKAGVQGSLDASFGTGGIVTTAGSINSAINCLVVQPDGKIVVGGYADDDGKDFLVARYTAAGAVDASFGSSGFVRLDLTSNEEVVYGLALQADGKIIAVGQAIPSSTDFAIVRLTTAGIQDPTFGTGGLVTLDVAGSGYTDVAKAVAVQGDGSILVAGTYGTSSYSHIAVAKFTSTGALDTSFGVSGVATASIGSYGDDVAGFAVQSDGKIVVASQADFSDFRYASLARFTAAGVLDTSFSSDGLLHQALNDWSYNDSPAAVFLQSDGKIVVAGSSTTSTYSALSLGRFGSAGELDAGFGSGGTTQTLAGTANSQGLAAALQPDGMILVAGYTVNSTEDFLLARYTSAGVLDSAFGSSGIVTMDVAGDADDAITSLAVQPDGMIVAGGYAVVGGISCFSLARFWP